MRIRIRFKIKIKIKTIIKTKIKIKNQILYYFFLNIKRILCKDRVRT